MSLETEIKEAFERHAGDPLPAGDTWDGIERRIQRSHRTRMILAGAGTAIAIVAVVLAVPRLGGNKAAEPVNPGPNPTATTRASAPMTVTAKIAVPASSLAAGPDAIWAVQRPEVETDPGKLVRIDPQTNEPGASIDVGIAPSSVAADANAVWVANGPFAGVAAPYPMTNSVMRVDPLTNKVVATIRVSEPQDVALGFGAVWVTSGHGADHQSSLVRIDPVTNTVTADIALGNDEGNPAYVAIGGTSVWVSMQSGAEQTTVYRIDPSTNKTLPPPIVIAAAQGSAPIAYGEGATWVARPGLTSASALSRIDPATGVVLGTIVLPDAAPVGLDTVTTGGGYVWAGSARGYLWRVDPRVNAPYGDPMLIGDAPPVPATDEVYAFGSVWVGAGDGKIWRIEP